LILRREFAASAEFWQAGRDGPNGLLKEAGRQQAALRLTAAAFKRINASLTTGCARAREREGTGDTRSARRRSAPKARSLNAALLRAFAKVGFPGFSPGTKPGERLEKTSLTSAPPAIGMSALEPEREQIGTRNPSVVDVASAVEVF
jgi:hypothetical protein